MKKNRLLNKKVLKNSIINIYKEFSFKSFNYKQISKKLSIKKLGDKIIVFEALNELRAEGLLKEIKTGSFVLAEQKKSTLGKVISTNKSGVIVCTANDDELFVEKKDSLFSLRNDLVEVIPLKTKKGTKKGFITNVLERKKKVFVGKVEKNNGIAFFIPEDYKVYFDIYLPTKKNLTNYQNKKVLAEVDSWKTENKNPSGKIIKVLGDSGEYKTEKSSILYNYGFSDRFSNDIIKYAESIDNKIDKNELKYRVDFRGVPTFTIDPDDAKDFDDAISVQELKNGNLEVGVHIADVSHYVKKEGILDKEALRRGTSVYLVDEVVPMLPEILSNDLCSLKPRVDRLCFAVIFELNKNAEICNYKICKTIIHSNKRFSYEEAQKNIDTSSGDFSNELIKINLLAKILRKNRKKNGSINFEKDETKFILDKKNNPIGVFVKQSLDTNKLIEEYMLLTNKTVTEHVSKKTNNFPFIYRIHDEPDREKISDLKNLVKKYNYNIQIDNPKILSKSLNSLLKDIKNSPEKNLIETLVLRSMAKAKYSIKNIGHYGLAFNHYSHFTSPIRRYPDLVIHRLIYKFINKDFSAYDKDLEYICKHCSEKEKEAASAERDSIKLMQIIFLSNQIGNTFTGVISGVTDWGIYVELDNNKCEGLIKMKNLSDDFLFYDNKTQSLSNSSKLLYQLGQKIKIKILSVNKENKQIDFIIA